MMLPPGPRAPAVWQTLAWMSRPGAFLQAVHRRFGDPATIRTYWTEEPMVLVSSPDAVHDVFALPAEIAPAGQSWEFLRPFAGPDSILLLDGDDHLRERRLLQKPFHGERMRTLGPLVADLAQRDPKNFQVTFLSDEPDTDAVKALEAFAAESGTELLRIATLLTSDPYIAEDVYQETLQRLAARWSRVDSPRAFCRRVLHNIVIDQSRAAARRPRETRLFPVSDSTDPRSADPHAAVEVRPALFAALDTLTTQQRAIVVLRYFEDRSEADVARLGVILRPGTAPV